MQRYVGYSYESVDQEIPNFLAKGIECVRRDNCPLVSKIVENSIKLFFDANFDVSILKKFMVSEWSKMFANQIGESFENSSSSNNFLAKIETFNTKFSKIFFSNEIFEEILFSNGKRSEFYQNLGNYVFAKEVKMGKYSARLSKNKKENILPLHVMIAKKRMIRDTRQEPLHGERVPFVVTYAIGLSSNSRLVDSVVEPFEFLSRNLFLKAKRKILQDFAKFQENYEEKKTKLDVFNGKLRLNLHYYIKKQMIPALDRIFSLVGVCVEKWFEEIKKRNVSLSAYNHFMFEDRFLKQILKEKDSKDGNAEEILTRKTDTLIDNFFASKNCFICGQKIEFFQNSDTNLEKEEEICKIVCENCLIDQVFLVSWSKFALRYVEIELEKLKRTCSNCQFSKNGLDFQSVDDIEDLDCSSLDCEVFFKTNECFELFEKLKIVDSLINKYLESFLKPKNK